MTEKLEKIKNDIDTSFDELEESLNVSNMILDLENFIFELKKDNLYTSELEDFINSYMKYKNA